MAPGCVNSTLRRRGRTYGKVCCMKKWLIVFGVVLLILGVVAVVHPDFTYSKKEEVLKVGPLQTNVERQDSVRVPIGVSILLLVAGVGLVVIGSQAKK